MFLRTVKRDRLIWSNFVAFSEYLNFKIDYFKFYLFRFVCKFCSYVGMCFFLGFDLKIEFVSTYSKTKKRLSKAYELHSGYIFKSPFDPVYAIVLETFEDAFQRPFSIRTFLYVVTFAYILFAIKVKSSQLEGRKRHLIFSFLIKIHGTAKQTKAQHFFSSCVKYSNKISARLFFLKVHIF